MIFQNKFSLPLPSLSSARPCVFTGKVTLFWCRLINNIYKEYKVIVTPGKHMDLTRLQHSLTESKENNVENHQSPKEKSSEKSVVL